MKQLKSILAFTALSATLFFTACKDDEPKPKEQKTEATITITSPEEHQEFDHGKPVTIAGKIEANAELHGYKIVVKQKSDGKEVVSKSAHAHGNTLHFTETWINDVEGMQDMELEVTAVIDHDGNTVSKKVNFHCHGH